MSGQDFEYEVAFSFVKEDESLATELNDLIQERLKTFLYSKKQEALVGKDGEQEFNEVFGKKARVVVVLYRSTWGSTPWTRIEETAIRNRGYEESYDFCILMPVASGISPPKWFPKNRLYMDLGRWGVKAAAAVIEARVQDAGGAIRAESTVERAQRIKRQMDAESERREFLSSAPAVQEAKKEAARLFEKLNQEAVFVHQQTGWEIKIQRDKNQRWIELYGEKGCLSVDWRGKYGNTLKESSLEVAIWEGSPPRSGLIYYGSEEPPKLFEEHYTFDRNYQGVFGWRLREEFVTSDQMADSALRLLMDFTQKNHMGN